MNSLSEAELTILIPMVLDYDPETGVLTWKNHKKAYLNGRRAGSLDRDGYLRVGLCKQKLYAHRIAWFLHFQKWPSCEIDHRNRDRSDNRISNLREAERIENIANSVRKRKFALPKGVYERGGRYRAYIGVNNKTYWLGSYRTPEEASAAYSAAAIKQFGEFARADE